MVKDLKQSLENSLPPGQKELSAHNKMLLDNISNCLQLGGTSAIHNGDGLARLNAYALRGLRSEWLSRSTLDSELKDKLYKAPLCDGEVMTESSVEFSAPIVGPVLKTELDQQYELKKKTEALKKKTQQVKRPASQGSFRGGRGGKKPKLSGGRPQSFNKPQQQNSAPQQSYTRGQKRGGRSSRGRGGRGAYNKGVSSGQQKNKQHA